MKLKKYTLEELTIAISESYSYRQVLQKLNIIPAGGNYQTLKKAIKVFSLDTSHFTGQLWSKGKTIGPKVPIEDYLNNNRSIGSDKLRKRLIRENYFIHQCSKCLRSHWNDQPIPLELEHIDGNHFNNLLSNLTLLCPNCHAQTSTYRGKNISKA